MLLHCIAFYHMFAADTQVKLHCMWHTCIMYVPHERNTRVTHERYSYVSYV